ncbi:MAG: hypothetical protein ACP5O0_07240 [Acidimicrobiales bacterium]
MSEHIAGTESEAKVQSRSTGAFYASVLLFAVALGLAGTLYLVRGLHEHSSFEPYAGGRTVIGRVVATQAVLDTSPRTWSSLIKYEVDGHLRYMKTLDTPEYLAVGSLQVLSYDPRDPQATRDISQRRGQWGEPIEFGVMADCVAIALGAIMATRLLKLRERVYSMA